MDGVYFVCFIIASKLSTRKNNRSEDILRLYSVTTKFDVHIFAILLFDGTVFRKAFYAKTYHFLCSKPLQLSQTNSATSANCCFFVCISYSASKSRLSPKMIDIWPTRHFRDNMSISFSHSYLSERVLSWKREDRVVPCWL